ncbi:DUF5597 domain-containing protein [Candidatus Poribacteria bacterium]
MKPLPQIVEIDGQHRMLVDDQPFLILGLQWDCDSCFSAEEMNPLFPHAARMIANTATLPTYWREVEPEPGRYDFRMVDERIHQARANGMRIIPLWFATWKNACAFYAADYIRNDPETYPRALDANGQPAVSLCPLSEATWQRDRDALVALMQHIKEVDDDRTVIMLQIENEPGVMGSDRCYCPVCNEQFTKGDWEAKYGENAAEAFSVISIASYIDKLSAEAKAVYPIPTYINVWMGSKNPGRSYPSGGAVPRMLKLFRQQLNHVDLVAPDIYASSYDDFHRLCQVYSADGNPLYIAETSSSTTGRAERNVFYALGQHGAIGFDPWAIDSPFPDRYGPPLVDPVGGEWGPQTYWLRDSYFAIARAMQPIVEAQGTDRLFTFVQEGDEKQTSWSVEGCDLLVSYNDQRGAARGMLIQQAHNEFLLIGLGFSVRFRRSGEPDQPVPVDSAEWGRYDGNRWVNLHPMRRERPESAGHPITLYEPGVARVTLSIPFARS